MWFTVPGAAYVISGMTQSFVPNHQCWKFDGTANTWVRKADFPGTPIIEGAGFSIGTKGYVGLGSDNTPTLGGFQSALWEYDTTLDTWSQKAPFPGTVRSGVATTVINQKAYVFGGGTWLNGVSNTTGELWEYDPATNAWTQKASCPGGGRFMPMAFTVGSKGYFGMGKDNGAVSPRDLYEYDPIANTWTPKQDYPGAARAYAIGMSLGNKGYVGMGDISSNGTDLAKDVWAYDPATNAWTRQPDLDGTGRAMAVGFALGSDLYFGLGTSSANQSLGDVWRWRPTAALDPATPTDSNGYVYRTVTIGSQVWLAENLRATRDTSGSALEGVYAYNDQESNVATHGRLYTWAAANRPMIAGWHLPTYAEWTTLINAVGLDHAGQILLQGGGSNFNALFSGYRDYGGGYRDIGTWSSCWSSTLMDVVPQDHAHIVHFYAGQPQVGREGSGITAGMPIRLVRDVN
jgi:uncharacterized protein (TIGR02145 family)